MVTMSDRAAASPTSSCRSTLRCRRGVALLMLLAAAPYPQSTCFRLQAGRAGADAQSSRRSMLAGACMGLAIPTQGADARSLFKLQEFGKFTLSDPRTDLLPPGEPGKEVILDLAGLLEPRQIERMRDLIARTEAKTNVRVRVLSQRSPEAPGSALLSYWKEEPFVIILAADEGWVNVDKPTANLLKANVGIGVDQSLYYLYWDRLRRMYGSPEYVRQRGAGQALFDAVSNVCYCLLRGECGDGVPLPASEVSSM
mmetsp:Transcript_46714/g.111100  ORF Transcript_46714/g.111100 Transcript_46714/m.111100 type:complete len:255 (-) Transcript_46714:46-810(-)